MFGLVDFMRAGLGNMLFPWARAVVEESRGDLSLLAPDWRQLRIGPYLRGERDKRQYQRLFKRASLNEKAERALTKHRLPVVEEDQHWRQMETASIVRFSGMRDYFKSFYNESPLITQKLVEEIRHPVAVPSHPYIAVHVRLGDFAPAAQAGRISGESNRSTPIDWYVQQLQQARSRMGDRPALICSDGSDEELSRLLRQPDVRRSRATSAIADIFALASGEIILGSGSTFSAWGSFLGQTPLVVEPGSNLYLAGSPLVTEAG